jgi:hypothetical protein
MHDVDWAPGGYHVLFDEPNAGPILTMFARHFFEVGWCAGAAARGDDDALEQLAARDPGTAQLVRSMREVTQ